MKRSRVTAQGRAAADRSRRVTGRDSRVEMPSDPESRSQGDPRAEAAPRNPQDLTRIGRLTLAAAALVASAWLYGGCSGLGEPKPGAPPHHLERGFRNLNPDYRRPSPWVRWPYIITRGWLSTFAPRSASFPLAPNDGAALQESRTDPTVTWIGHSTLLIQLDGVNLLTDPHWSERASPVAFLGPRRLAPPGLRFEDLPPIHTVLISHDHYDHLDIATVKRLAATHRPRFLTPLGYRAWFADLGIADVEELDWWESRELRDLRLTAVPVQHWTSRAPWEYNRRLWSGWVVAGRDRRLFFAGDTGYYDVLFRELGRRLGPFDLAAIPIGAYLPPAMMRLSHTTPEEALRVLQDVRGRVLLPVHWGTFDIADEPLEEPPARLRENASRLGIAPDRLWIMRHGETRRW
jgi:N-acyl-phosphatidylethanolamine-hydrolysing phospholipase D